MSFGAREKMEGAGDLFAKKVAALATYILRGYARFYCLAVGHGEVGNIFCILSRHFLVCYVGVDPLRVRTWYVYIGTLRESVQSTK